MQTDGPLDALAAQYVVPALSGVYLTRGELLSLARATDASLRINERKRMLTDVLRSAQDPAALRRLLGRLIAFCEQHVAEYQATAQTWPVAAPLVQPWIDRARGTSAALQQVIEELELAERSAPSHG